MDRESGKLRRWTTGVTWLIGSALGLGATAPQQELTEVLRRASDTVVRYMQESATILADEGCRQRTCRSAFTPGTMGLAKTIETVTTGQRRWKAELALLQLPDEASIPWLEIRDVLEVDGQALPDREARLQRLFYSDPKWKVTRARDIVEESAKYNLGAARRTINTPAIPLLILHGPNQSRFTFDKAGEAKVDGVAAWKVEFREQRRPTLFGAADTRWDMPSAGTFWIVPDTGEVLRAQLVCGAMAETKLTVTYRRHPEFGLVLPAEMTERASAVEDEWVEGRCSYSNFRRFQTSGRLLPPKPPDASPEPPRRRP